MRNETRSVIRRELRLHKHVFAFFATSVGCGATDSYRVEGENGVWGGNGMGIMRVLACISLKSKTNLLRLLYVNKNVFITRVCLGVSRLYSALSDATVSVVVAVVAGVTATLVFVRLEMQLPLVFADKVTLADATKVARLLVEIRTGMQPLWHWLNLAGLVIAIAFDNALSALEYCLMPGTDIAGVQLIQIRHLAIFAGQETIVNPFQLFLRVATRH